MLQGLGTKLEKDVLLEKFKNPVLNSVYIEDWSTLSKSFVKTLPYSLTPSQLSAASEIIWDLKRPIPMNRLLQVLLLLLFFFLTKWKFLNRSASFSGRCWMWKNSSRFLGVHGGRSIWLPGW